jgi:uncharacterized protein YutE (UPF0331/DUF86 family)
MSPSELDAVLVRRHLLALDEALKNLGRHRGRSLDELAQDMDELWTVERGLQLCAQNVLDIATHVAASSGRDVPDYVSAIDRLGEMGVLPREFVARFRGVAGFRNIIVHGYLAIDVRLVHQLLNERLDDFALFARQLEGYLARKR